jgi:hypothetical protein
MAEANTLSTIMERYAAARSPRSDLPTKITATGGSTDTILEDTVNAFSTGDDSAFDGNWWAYITTDAGGSNAAPEGEFGRIASFDYSAGQWTLGSTLTAAIAAGDTAVLLPDHPDDIIESINDVQRSVYLPAYMPLSMTADAGMGDSGTDAYTALGGATLAKVTSTLAVFSGSQSLYVTSGGTIGDGFRTEDILDNILVDYRVGEQFVCSVIYRIISGQWEIAVINNDNSTDIETVDLHTSTYTKPDSKWYEARFTFSVDTQFNSGFAISAQDTQGAGTIIAIDSIYLLSTERSNYVLDSRINDASHVDRIMYQPQGQTTEYSDVYVPFARPFMDWPVHGSLRDYEALNSHRVELLRYPTEPLWVSYMDTQATLSSTTDTSDVPLEIMVEGVQAFMWGKRAKRSRNRALRDEYQQNFIQSTRVFDQLLLDRGLGKPRIKTPAPRKVSV